MSEYIWTAGILEPGEDIHLWCDGKTYALEVILFDDESVAGVAYRRLENFFDEIERVFSKTFESTGAAREALEIYDRAATELRRKTEIKI